MSEHKATFMPTTDLAIEIGALLKENQPEDYQIEGVDITTSRHENEEIILTHVHIKDETGEKNMGKPIGNYITIETEQMKENDPEVHFEIIAILAEELKKLINPTKDTKVLVVGLGNRQATPDALGPQVADKVFVTRHLHEHIPDEIDDSICSLSSLAPGVMGLTGIETSEIIRGVVQKTQPDCVIAIDALGSRSAKRINATIQIADTGISPGAGIGNKRKMLNEANLGCKVIGIGVPTVVDAATLVNDTMDHLIHAMLEQSEGSSFYQTLKDLGQKEKYSMIKEVITPTIGNLFVTPKDMDEIVDYLTNIISNAINVAVHPGVNLDDINKYSY